MSTSRLYIDPEIIKKAAEDDWANAFARIENHYFVNGVSKIYMSFLYVMLLLKKP